ncbi:MAG: tyrosine--tRNA ligase [Candidatus Aenigmarchaeota archaeon]|nr:tyrosine--tRNA ligase [Candidatus Aenigmarchaeota archaeon]MDW8149643.1 tyrosine--tRNA ligase [Candidatus Aenigmarchaeota archaeon]
MDIEERIELVKKSPTEEILTEKELRELFETNSKIEHYIGFEISGYLHLGTLFISGTKINDFDKANIKTKVFLADWHSFMNNKLGGNWEKIKTASKYYSEAFKFFCKNVEVILGSELYYNNNEYWKDVVKFSSKITIDRCIRCLPIMGRSRKDKLSFSQFLYPALQAVDVKYLCNIAHGGMDQRKVHILCREVFPKLEWEKPIAIHHHLLIGLSEPPKKIESKEDFIIQAKMSKSKPWTAIFIHDSEEEILHKLKRAYCPAKIVENNPVLEIAKYLIFRFKSTFFIERESKYGKNLEFHSYEELEKAFLNGEIHPLDLKINVAREINEIIKPVREYFEKPSNKKLLEALKSD